MRVRMMVVLELLITIGCGSTHVVPVQNVERATTVWQKGGSSIAHLCLEYSSPAEKLEATKASLGIPIGDKNVNVSYESSESLATIYTVSEIMQFGHAALYRLCEAAGNGTISPDQFSTLFENTLNSMHQLIKLQLSVKSGATGVVALQLINTIHEIDEQLCDLMNGPTVEESLWKEATGKRDDAEKLLNELKPHISENIKIPDDTVPKLKESVQKYFLARNDAKKTQSESKKDKDKGKSKNKKVETEVTAIDQVKTQYEGTLSAYRDACHKELKP